MLGGSNFDGKYHSLCIFVNGKWVPVDGFSGSLNTIVSVGGMIYVGGFSIDSKYDDLCTIVNGKGVPVDGFHSKGYVETIVSVGGMIYVGGKMMIIL